MNILVVTQMYSQPDDTGDNKPTKTVNYFAREWVAMGHRVVVMHCPSKFPIVLYKLPAFIKERFAGRISTMVPSIESRKVLEREENGVKVFRLPMLKPAPGRAYSRRAMAAQARRIEQRLESIGFRPEMVLGHFANPSTELVALLSGYYGVHSSIVFHHDCTEGSIRRYRLAENVGRIGAIGCRSLIEAECVKQLLALKEMPFICCSGAPNDAVEAAERYCTKQAHSGGTRYIYVGSLIQRKHVDTVLRAFDDVAKENDTLRVIGGGPEEGSLRALAGELASGDRICFTGRIPRSEVLSEMKRAQVFTLVSHGETYGMVYIEAMLQGCIVIASRGEGFDGIIRNGVNGFICEPGDRERLADVYRHIASMSGDERNRIGQAAIDTAVHYSEREVAQRYLEDVSGKQRSNGG